MLSFFKKVFFIILITGLAGCTLFRNNPYLENRDTDYLKAYSVSPLVIPPGLSTSTIKAHYPISGRNYPPCLQKVNLTPPELVNYVPVPRRVVSQAVVSEPVPVSRPILSVLIPFSKQSPSAPVTAQNTSSHLSYYDNFTRSTSSTSNKSGVPLSSILPTSNSKSPTNSKLSTAPVTGAPPSNSMGPVQTTNTSGQQPKSQQPKSMSSAIINSLSSLWTWGNSKPNTVDTDSTKTDSSVKQAENNPSTQDIKKQYYFDNFTHR